MATLIDGVEPPILKERRVLVTRVEVRIGRLRVPAAGIEGVRVERDRILLPLALIVVFSALCLSCVSIEDDVGCAVFALAAIGALLGALFPRHVLMLDTGSGERRVLAGWSATRLLRIRHAIEAVRHDRSAWRPQRAA